ncbi:MAG TPA: type IX secretion system membrane protein PorP/SprF, partial [Pricia sp.]|nr:type IX secretion system membrane protein PorP/SprF [Pricia sp.]
MTLRGQDERLPADLRQHNLTTYNASLFNPAFSLGRNNPASIALWVRWQWQGIDADPSTLFLNYTRKLSGRSAGGAAFFQHNTGIFFNTGGAINYAYKFEFNPRVKLA